MNSTSYVLLGISSLLFLALSIMAKMLWKSLLQQQNLLVNYLRERDRLLVLQQNLLLSKDPMTLNALNYQTQSPLPDILSSTGEGPVAAGYDAAELDNFQKMFPNAPVPEGGELIDDLSAAGRNDLTRDDEWLHEGLAR
jgi:hypothetical protein